MDILVFYFQDSLIIILVLAKGSFHRSILVLVPPKGVVLCWV